MSKLWMTTPTFWVGHGAVGLAAAAMLYVGYLGAAGRPSRVVETRRPVYSSPDAAPPARLEHLEAGLRFDDRRPPKGWSRLVLRSTPRLASGDLDTLSEEAIRTADRVRVAIAADVVPRPGAEGYALGRVGVGLSALADDDKGEVIVTTRAVAGSKGPWSAKHRIILAAGSYELSHAALVASTSTFALVRMPTRYLTGGEHQKGSLDYAFLVDPDSGLLRAFVWLEDPNAPPRVLNELKMPASLDGALDVKAGTIAGVPLTWSFAMIAVPGDAQHRVDPELAARLATARLDATAPDDLEATIAAVAATPSRPPVKAPRPASSGSRTPAP